MNTLKHCSLALFLASSVSTFADTPKAHTASEHTAHRALTTQQAILEERSKNNIYRAYFPNADIGRKAVISFHAQLHEANFDDGYLILELTPEEINRLQDFDFTFKPASKFIEKRNIKLQQIQQSLQFQSASQAAAIPGYACYETVEETFAEADRIVAQQPNLAEFIDVGNSWEKTQGLGGYDIKVLVLTNKTTTGDKPKLFINSAIHAREYTTAPLVLAFANWLVDNYQNDADARWLLDHHEIHLMLQTNPDGRKQAETGLSWRKNVNQNYCSPTSNTRGADLNRNFSDRWNITNGVGSSGNQCNLTYRGPFAGSEPEVQALESYVRSIFPDRRGPNDNDAAPADTSGIHLDIHSFSELVLWPWGDVNSVAPNGTALQTLGRKFAFFNGYTPQQSVGLYPTDGTSDSISYAELGVAAFTFELGTSFFQSCSVFNNSIKPDNIPALIYAAKVVRTPYITPAGPDVTTITLSANATDSGVVAGTPVTLNTAVTDTRFSSRNGTEATQNIAAVEYYIDTPPWQSGANAIALSASDGAFNEKTEEATATIDTSGLSVGQHIVFVRSRDASNVWGAVSAEFLVIRDGQTPTEPEARFSSICNDLNCTFDASQSTGNINSYQWSFGDGNTATGSNVNYTFSQSGSYNVSLTVSDGSASDSITETISVTEPTAGNITISLSSGSFFFYNWVDVAWGDAQSSQVDIYRNGSLLTTTANDGRYRNFTSRGTYTYQVCEAGSVSNCSTEETISF